MMDMNLQAPWYGKNQIQKFSEMLFIIAAILISVFSGFCPEATAYIAGQG